MADSVDPQVFALLKTGSTTPIAQNSAKSDAKSIDPAEFSKVFDRQRSSGSDRAAVSRTADETEAATIGGNSLPPSRPGAAAAGAPATPAPEEPAQPTSGTTTAAEGGEAGLATDTLAAAVARPGEGGRLVASQIPTDSAGILQNLKVAGPATAPRQAAFSKEGRTITDPSESLRPTVPATTPSTTGVTVPSAALANRPAASAAATAAMALPVGSADAGPGPAETLARSLPANTGGSSASAAEIVPRDGTAGTRHGRSGLTLSVPDQPTLTVPAGSATDEQVLPGAGTRSAGATDTDALAFADRPLQRSAVSAEKPLVDTQRQRPDPAAVAANPRAATAAADASRSELAATSSTIKSTTGSAPEVPPVADGDVKAVAAQPATRREAVTGRETVRAEARAPAAPVVTRQRGEAFAERPVRAEAPIADRPEPVPPAGPRGADMTPPQATATAATVGAPASPAIPAPAPSSNAAAAGLVDVAMDRSPEDPEFADEFTARMKVMVRDGVREARLQLHPAELGRLQVTVTTDGDQARISFVADTAAAKEAIEQSLPRLRDMLEQNGLQLAQSDVGQRGLASQQSSDESRGSGVAEAESVLEAETDEGEELPGPAPGLSNSRIDTYI